MVPERFRSCVVKRAAWGLWYRVGVLLWAILAVAQAEPPAIPDPIDACPASGHIDLRLVDPRKSPLSGLELRTVVGDDYALGTGVGVTDIDGRASIPCTPGQRTLVTLPPGWGDVIDSDTLDFGWYYAGDTEIQRVCDGTLTVLDADGTPVQGAEVYPLHTMFRDGSPKVTDAAGQVRLLARRCAGDWTAVGVGDRFGASVNVRFEDSPTQEVRLPPLAHARIRVLRPLGVTAVYVDAGLGFSGQRTNPPGWIDVAANASRVSIHILALPGPRQLEVWLPLDGRDVTIRHLPRIHPVKPKKPSPPATAWIEGAWGPGGECRVQATAGRVYAEGSCDDAGRFRIGPLPPGIWPVYTYGSWVFGDVARGWTRTDVRLRTGQTTDVGTLQPAAGVLEGTIVADFPLTDARLYANTLEVEIDPGGHFRATGQLPGGYVQLVLLTRGAGAYRATFRAGGVVSWHVSAHELTIRPL